MQYIIDLLCIKILKTINFNPYDVLPKLKLH